MNTLHKHLYHYDQPGTIQAVTFRLNDSMPANLRREWASILAMQQPQTRQSRIQTYIDRGMGSCLLRQPSAAKIVEEKLLEHHPKRYRLLAWVIMPNHLHIILLPRDGFSLASIIRDWKVSSARDIKYAVPFDGAIWHRDYYDRYIRSEVHLLQAILYVHNNPVKAGLVAACREWPFSSARFVPEPDMTYCTPFPDSPTE